MPPPSIADPLANVGYLIAALVVTVTGLVGYAVALARQLHEAEQQRRDLQDRVAASGPGPVVLAEEGAAPIPAALSGEGAASNPAPVREEGEGGMASPGRTASRVSPPRPTPPSQGGDG